MFGLILGLIISALALALAIRWSGWQQLRLALMQVDLRFVLLAVFVFLLSMMARAAAWQALLNWQFPYLRVLAVLNEGYFLSNLLPFRLGEIGRAIILSRSSSGRVISILSSIFTERLYDMVLAVTLLFILFPYAVDLPGAVRVALILGVILGLVVFGLITLLRKSEFVEAILRRLPGGLDRWGNFWDQMRSGFRALEDGKVFSASAFFMLLSWALAGLEYWLVIRAVTADVRLEWAFFMLTVTLLGGAIPSSPGYIGVFEAAGVLALTVFNVSQADGLAAAIILHAITFILASGFGAIAMINEGESLTSLYRYLQTWLQENARGNSA